VSIACFEGSLKGGQETEYFDTIRQFMSRLPEIRDTGRPRQRFGLDPRLKLLAHKSLIPLDKLVLKTLMTLTQSPSLLALRVARIYAVRGSWVHSHTRHWTPENNDSCEEYGLPERANTSTPFSNARSNPDSPAADGKTQNTFSSSIPSLYRTAIHWHSPL
jgi:hypothetical protein